LLALTDELTGLYNHRYFKQRLTQEVARAQRLQGPVGLLFVDIDHFKVVNDTWGHPAGDAVLRHLAEVLSASVGGDQVIVRLRRADIVARYGGEEFAILLPDARCEGASAVAERIRADLAKHQPVLEDGTHVPLTISIGVASWPRCASDEDGLLRAADDALYRAKHEGRDRVVIAP
jgi:diguanylate cyclase (GGDEF)-like protein